METIIDMRTIIITLVLGNLSTVLLIMAYSFKHKNNISITVFTVAKWLQLVAFSLIGLRAIAPFFITVVVANTFLLLGASLECIALLLIKNAFNKPMKNRFIILTTACIFTFYLSVIFFNLENIRIAIVSLSTVLFVLFPVFYFLKDKNASALQRLIAFLYILVMLALIFRSYTALFTHTSMTMFSSNLHQTISFLVLFLEMLLGSIGFVLLAKEEIDLELVRMASIDDLTNIYNRRAFISHATNSISLFSKRKEPISFILFDIDYFKEINDTYGHDVGDMVLKKMTTSISSGLRKEDLFGRYGGDEFAILLLGPNEADSNQIVESIQEKMERISFQGLDLRCSLSIGIITVIPDTSTNIDILYKLSDTALYEAKQKGRNRFSRISIEKNVKTFLH